MKLAATRRVFEAAARVDAVAVASGVPEQPFGTEETVRGARNRARRALAADRGARVAAGPGESDPPAVDGSTEDPGQEEGSDAPAPGSAPDPAAYDLGVGVEGGVAERPGTEGLFLVMWAAVTDGDRTEVGSGPALRLPDRVARWVRDGEELGPVMDDRLDEEGVARGQGAAGVLTGGAIDREAALAAAVAGAAGPFRTDQYRD